MLGWLQTTAEWAGPIAAILNFVIAAVGLPIAIWKGLKARRVIVAWFGSVLGSTQEASTQSTRAADNSAAAAQNATGARVTAEGARESADGARENARQVSELLEWAVPELMKKDAIIESLKERVDGLLGTRARQAAYERTGQFLLPPSAAGEDDPATETGRHRLHTSLINTGGLTQQDYDPYQTGPS